MSPTERLRSPIRRPSGSGAVHTRANSTALDRSDIGSPGSVSIRPGTFSVAAASSARGLVTVGNAATTAFGFAGMPAAANTAVDAPNPWPTMPSLVGCTLIFPSPSRTPAMMSSVVPRSNARFSTDGATPFSVSGAAATMPHDARCSSVPK